MVQIKNKDLLKKFFFHTFSDTALKYFFYPLWSKVENIVHEGNYITNLNDWIDQIVHNNLCLDEIENKVDENTDSLTHPHTHHQLDHNKQDKVNDHVIWSDPKFTNEDRYEVCFLTLILLHKNVSYFSHGTIVFSISLLLLHFAIFFLESETFTKTIFKNDFVYLKIVW